MQPVLIRSIFTILIALSAVSLDTCIGLAEGTVPAKNTVSAVKWRAITPSLERFEQGHAKAEQLLGRLQGKAISTSLAQKTRIELSGARTLVQGIKQMERQRVCDRVQWNQKIVELKGRIARLTVLKYELENSQPEAGLSMIQLQSVMSQRQTAIQLTSNLIQSLSDTQAEIVDNLD